jgi:hypothetical protein
MGGAVALLLHQKEPLFYHGAVLVAPMCKVNKLIYQDKPRLKTALEMLRTSMRVEESLKQVCYQLCSSAPFIYSEVSIQARYIYGDWVNWIVELAGDTTIRSVAWRRRYSDRP